MWYVLETHCSEIRIPVNHFMHKNALDFGYPAFGFYLVDVVEGKMDFFMVGIQVHAFGVGDSVHAFKDQGNGASWRDMTVSLR